MKKKIVIAFFLLILAIATVSYTAKAIMEVKKIVHDLEVENYGYSNNN
ncbi:MAG TPA: hypothetical protein VLG50_03725 [Candidatus Saccharimonadales bacterium]|nr:hypothetical protein [Candidatus Saccharimonadales bacterium]